MPIERIGYTVTPEWLDQNMPEQASQGTAQILDPLPKPTSDAKRSPADRMMESTDAIASIVVGSGSQDFVDPGYLSYDLGIIMQRVSELASGRRAPRDSNVENLELLKAAYDKAAAFLQTHNKP